MRLKNTQIIFVCDGEVVRSFIQVLKKLNNCFNITFITKNNFFISSQDEEFLKANTNLIYIDKINLLKNKSSSNQISSFPFFVDRFFSYGTFGKLTESEPYPFKINNNYKYLYTSLDNILKKNSIVFGYSNATYYENIIKEICIKKNIEYLILKHTRIENYFSLFSLTSNKFDFSYVNNKIETEKPATKSYIGEKTKEYYQIKYLDLVRAVIAILRGKSREIKNNKLFIIRIFYAFYYLYIKLILHNSRSFIKKIFYYFNKNTIKKNSKIILFPLMAEPEVNISQFVFPFINTYELLKAISLSIPENYQLVIKDHPRNFKWRSILFGLKVNNLNNTKYLWNYDNKFNDKVYLTIGFNGNLIKEAILNNKKVFTFCDTQYDNYNFLNHKKIKIKDLYKEIIKSSQLKTTDKKIITKYLDDIKKHSIRLNFMTDIVGKKNRSRDNNLSKNNQINDITKLIKNKMDE